MPRAYRRRQTVNTPGFEAPVLDPISAPDPPPPSILPNPRLMDPPPAGMFALRPVEGPLALVADRSGVRAIGEADIEELLEWGVPAYQARGHKVTAEAILPLCRVAIGGFPFRALRTDYAFGVFAADKKPWEVTPAVVDLFLAWRDAEFVHQAVQICRSARQWAKSVGAYEFRLVECDESMAAIAERIGGFTQQLMTHISVL
jgi:hypothetical protein